MPKMDSKNLYITTTLPYVNADPHIGFAFELVQADIIARVKKLQGFNVFFNTGTDEHGMKIFQKAKEEGKDPQAYVDEYAEKFKQLKNNLNLDPGLHFIRTTDSKHIEAAQEIWKKCFKKGDIYKKKYKGLYCVGDEAFVKESDLVDGKCPNHPNMDLVEIEEENYFFKLTNYKEQLKEYLNKKESVIPETRRKEAQSIVDALEDISISRDKSRFSWGVPVPEDDSQVMYVWFDALTSYISTLGWPNSDEFDKFWTNGQTLQLAGKDQVKFQSIIWQAMLFSADLPNTKTVLYHGFITSGGKKMSKSLGNVINPNDLIEKYGVDALRYYLAREVTPFEDSDVTEEKFKVAYNANLANGLGNLVSRVMKMAEDNLEEAVKIVEFEDMNKFFGIINNFEINKAADYIWLEIGKMDLFIQENVPFKVVKTDKDAGQKMISELVTRLYSVARMLNPILPETSSKIKELIEQNKSPGQPLFARMD